LGETSKPVGIKNKGNAKGDQFGSEERCSLVIPLVRVDVTFPVKNIGIENFPEELAGPFPAKRMHIWEKFPADTEPANFL
jgi:hypothetical protein